MDPGTKVKDLDGRFGIVVYDYFNLCRVGCISDDTVFVEFDGGIGVYAVEKKSLKTIGRIQAKIQPKKCENCIFNNGSHCLRYKLGRIGIVLSSKNGKRIPNGIYPDCYR